jgi:hypothetical protein
MKHRYGDPYRETYRTTRTCVKCGLQKITHHEGRLPWIDFWRDATCLGAKTPPCEPVKVEAIDAAA